VALHNQSEEPLTIAGATLIDFADADRAPGVDPWALEKESQTVEQQYKRAGVDFARGAMPRVLIVGASATTGAMGGFLSAAVAVAAAVSVIALPIYEIVVWRMNRLNKAAVTAEFARRRLAFPLTLAAGETRNGSLFLPLVPNPHSLTLQWSRGPVSNNVTLSLAALHGLHSTSPASKRSQKPK
jgi:hypothetical protein